MTSKALEAAAKVLAEANYMIPWDDMDSVDRLEVLDICTNMIRAFADNLSEEAANEAFGRVEIELDEAGNFLRGKRLGCVNQIRAAIAKGME